VNQLRLGSSQGLKILNVLKNNQGHISAWLTAILLILTAWILGQLVWKPFVSPQVAAWQPSNVSRTVAAQPQLNIAELKNSHLFGEFKTSQPVVAVQPELEDAPKSRLNVTLVGVVTSTQAEKSLAVIAQGGQQATYGINETIKGTRAKLVQVQGDRVIVDNSGRNETVMLQGIDYSRPVQNNQAKSKTPRQTSPSLSNQTKSQLAKVRAEISKDPKQIFQYVRMSQFKQGDVIVGYRLSAGKSRELFESVGLQDGDIATHLNGQDLREPSAMGDIFSRLSELTELNLTVERDGQPYDIYIEL